MAKQNQTGKLNEDLAFLRDQITSIGAQIGEAINDKLEETVGIVDRVSNTINKTTAKAAVKSVTDLTKGLDTALQNQLKINQGAIKLADITKAQQSLEARRLTLTQNLQNLENLGLITAKERKKQEIEIGDALDKESKILQNQVNAYDSINKKLGITGKLVGGISKIPVLGNLIDAEEALGAAQMEAAKDTATSTSVMKKAFSSLGTSLKANLMDPLTGITMVVAGVKALYEIFKKVDAETGNFAKEMGISYDEARATRKEFENLAASSGDVNITATKLLQTQLEINKALGANANLTEEDLITYTKLRDVAKVEPEILAESLKLSKLRGVSLKDATSSLLGQLKVIKAQTGINFSNKEIMADVAKVSAATKLSLGGSTTELVKSVAQAKALGTSLGKLDNIAGSLLDFESSISAELEAELVTGRELNLEGARRAALNNDLVGLGKELQSQGIDAAKFGKMNRIQQEAIAKSMGMSRDEMSEMLMEQQALQALGKQNMGQVKDAYELARKQGKEKEFLAKLGNDELGQQLKSQSVQERMAAAQEKFVSAFEKLSPILEAILTPIADFAGFLTKSKPLMDAIVKGALLLAGIKFANFLGLSKSLGGLGGMLGKGGLGGMLGGGGGGAVGGAAKQLSAKQVAAGFGGKAAKEALKTGGMEAAQSAMAGGGGAASGGMFKGLLSGAKGLASKLNPLSYLKVAVKEAGGAKGLFKNSLKKIPGLNTLLTGFFAYNDIKSLLENPVDENGKPLSKDQVNQQVGKIVAGGLGGILGGALGTVIGGPIGTIVGSMGGDWLFKNLIGMFPDASGALGESITPFFEKSPDKADDFIVNNGKMTKFRKDDLIVGGTKLDSGGNNTEILSALRELISAVRSGGNVYLDGTKVGTAMSVGTYKIQ
jgi:hypothetical protein